MTVQNNPRPWQHVASRRRHMLTLLSAIPTFFILYVESGLLHGALNASSIVFLATQFILSGFLVSGFWTAVAGFWVLASGHKDADDPVSRAVAPRHDVSVGLLFPVYNEDMDRVLAGLANTWRSICRTDDAEHFQFFVLSDSRKADQWVREELMVAELAETLGLGERLHYRRRSVNLNMKSGNISDWVRRWGYTCDYMVVFDADSVMSGATLSTMLRTMEGNPRCGILQTNCIAVMRETLYARMQQFAGRLYGPLFSAGLRFWQQGDGHYVGHNAIIRTEAFRQACALPTLTGRPPYGGHLLSHDFVEAALMAKAGWDVWFLPELEGSWEEIPPTVLDELQRDRRWAQGNTQHIRLLFADGIRSAHRFLFVNGVFAFLSAPLWAAFMVVSMVMTVSSISSFDGSTILSTLTQTRSGFPYLLAYVFIVLLTPKLLSVILVLKTGRAKMFGGVDKLLWSVLLEVTFSACVASLKMVYHSKFVIQALLGMSVRWSSQVRDDRGLTWSMAWRFFGWTSVFGVLLGLTLYHFAMASPLLHFMSLVSPQLVALRMGLWFAPVLIGLAMSVPVAVVTSRLSVGRAMRSASLFVIPEEIDVPAELNLSRETSSIPDGDMFVLAVVDPRLNALHASLQTTRKHRFILDGLEQKALLEGPTALSEQEKSVLLRDRKSMTSLHWNVWDSPENGPWSSHLTAGTPAIAAAAS